MVGARSALFLPFADLGLIVVDEEHDRAYKQEDGVFYHARDMAVVRGSLGGFPVVLASATPSLESRVNAEPGATRALDCPTRFGAPQLPDDRAIDMRRDAAGARPLAVAAAACAAIGETLAAGEQALLFLNRRGYAPLTLCRACGHRFQCPNCSSWLVEHRFRGGCVCHHCGHHEAGPDGLPGLRRVEGQLAACGPGVERLAEEARGAFPTRASSSCRPTSPAAPARLKARARGDRQGRVPTSSSAPSSSPRGTISRS